MIETIVAIFIQNSNKVYYFTDLIISFGRLLISDSVSIRAIMRVFISTLSL